jgi:hypothetical protein
VSTPLRTYNYPQPPPSRPRHCNDLFLYNHPLPPFLPPIHDTVCSQISGALPVGFSKLEALVYVLAGASSHCVVPLSKPVRAVSV